MKNGREWRTAGLIVLFGAAVLGGSALGVAVIDGDSGTTRAAASSGSPGAAPESAPESAPEAPPPSLPPINLDVIQALLAPRITGSVAPASGDVWHNGPTGVCLDAGSGATNLTVDVDVHVGPGRTLSSVSATTKPSDVSDVTSWVAADGSLFYTAAFNGYLPGPYTLTLSVVDNTGADAQLTKPFVVHACAHPA